MSNIRLLAQPAFEVKCDDFSAGPGLCESTYPDGHRRFAKDLDPTEKARIWPEMGLRKKSIKLSQLIAQLHTQAPRYTSYPTAPQWTPLEAQTYQAHLHSLTSPLSLYIHIPFCRSMCLYCGCSVILNRRPEREEQYVRYLEKEILLLSKQLPTRMALHQIHFGGGTPTQLSGPLLVQLMSALRMHFSCETLYELAIEIDPRTVATDGGEKLSLLKQLGFNRISFGVQDTDPQVQEAVLRRQSREMTLETYAHARQLGFEHINIDLIYGLPYQTCATFAQTTHDVIAMRPNRISLFSYAKVPWLKPHQKAIKESTLPSTEEKLQIYIDARAAFLSAGYLAIGMDHFALADDELAQAYLHKTLQRNFQGYSVGHTEYVLGLGVTAIGYLGSCYAQNCKELPTYYAALDRGELPVARGKILSSEDTLRKWVIHTLMCRFQIDKAEFAARFHQSFDTHFQDCSLSHFEEEGLWINTAERLTVTPLGELFIRNLAMTFDGYQQMTLSQFSQSI